MPYRNKIVIVQKNRNANSSAKKYIADNQPVILFFELDKKVLLTFKDVLIDDAKSDYLPIYLQALFPVDNFCNECATRKSKNCIKFVDYIYNGVCNEVYPDGILLIY